MDTQFTVTRTTTETFAVTAGDAKQAKEEFAANGGTSISHDERIQVQPRPQGMTRSGVAPVRPTPVVPSAPA